MKLRTKLALFSVTTVAASIGVLGWGISGFARRKGKTTVGLACRVLGETNSVSFGAVRLTVDPSPEPACARAVP